MYCRFCGSEIQMDSRYCAACGKSLAQLELQEDEISTNEFLSDEKMMICGQCKVLVRKIDLRCDNCGADRSTFTVQVNDKNRFRPENDVDQSTSEVITGQPRLPRATVIVIWSFILFLVVGFVVFNNSQLGNSSPSNNSNQTNAEGHWISKCRNITELNPNYFNSDPSSIVDNLNGPSRFITRRQCTDVWVQP